VAFQTGERIHQPGQLGPMMRIFSAARFPRFAVQAPAARFFAAGGDDLLPPLLRQHSLITWGTVSTGLPWPIHSRRDCGNVRVCQIPKRSIVCD
jgi:hypothetical protein